jgi:hypothetical protein
MHNCSLSVTVIMSSDPKSSIYIQNSGLTEIRLALCKFPWAFWSLHFTSHQVSVKQISDPIDYVANTWLIKVDGVKCTSTHWHIQSLILNVNKLACMLLVCHTSDGFISFIFSSYDALNGTPWLQINIYQLTWRIIIWYPRIPFNASYAVSSIFVSYT